MYHFRIIHGINIRIEKISGKLQEIHIHTNKRVSWTFAVTSRFNNCVQKDCHKFVKESFLKYKIEIRKSFHISCSMRDALVKKSLNVRALRSSNPEILGDLFLRWWLENYFHKFKKIRKTLLHSEKKYLFCRFIYQRRERHKTY